MRDEAAICAIDLGKRFLRGWEPHLGMRRLAERTVRAPFDVLSTRLRRSRRPAPAGDGEFWALRDVSFEIPRGQITGLIGPNGAGKSVLLKILSRITQPTEGLAEVRGRVGAILEGGAAMHPELTGRENLRLSGALFGMHPEEVQRKMPHIVHFAELASFLDTPVKRYSTGMVARFALGVAVHFERDVLLIDETLASGDEAFRNKCIHTIRALADDGRTVIFVSHDLDLVRQLCDRCLHLEGGRLLGHGPTSDILARYGARARRPLARGDSRRA